MDTKKDFILTAACQLFMKNGVNQTSINDIAVFCKMSKSTFYKIFNSKEHLIFEIFDFVDHQFLKDAKLLYNKPFTSQREKLELLILATWKNLDARQSIGHGLDDSLGKEDIDKLVLKAKLSRDTVIREYQNILVHCFGTDIIPILDDLTVCYKGLIMELILLKHSGYSAFDPDAIKVFVATTLEAIVRQRKNDESILDCSYFLHHSTKVPEQSLESTLEMKFNILKSQLNYVTNINYHQKLFDAIDGILIEISAKRFDSLLAEAYLCFLEKEQPIHPHLEQIKQLIRQLKVQA